MSKSSKLYKPCVEQIKAMIPKTLVAKDDATAYLSSGMHQNKKNDKPK